MFTHQEYKEEDRKSKYSASIYFLIAAVLLLVFTNGYFYVRYRNSERNEIFATNDRSRLAGELDRIEGELARVSNDHIAISEELKVEREEARAALETLRTRLAHYPLNGQEFKRIQDEVVVLREEVGRYSLEVRQLREKNKLLVSERDSLRLSVHTALQRSTAIEAKSSALESQLSRASALIVSSININALRIKKNGKQSRETKAKRADKLGIEFNLVQNDMARFGKYDVFIRVIDPSGNLVLPKTSHGRIGQTNLQYSDKTSIQFSNDGKSYHIDWAPPVSFLKGNYTVMLYNYYGSMGKSSIILN